MLALITAIVQLALGLMRFAERRQLIAEANAKVRDDYIRAADEIGRMADAARAGVSDDALSVQNDPDNRDRGA